MLFERPSWDEYWLNMVEDAKTRSNCFKRQVGAILVNKENDVISMGYNGTPSGTINCFDGGCLRCSSNVPSGSGYDYCLCVHAEINAVLMAARQGKATLSSTMYINLAPCIQCVKHIIQAGVDTVIHTGGSVPMSLTEDHRNMVISSGIEIFDYSDELKDVIGLDREYYFEECW